MPSFREHEVVIDLRSTEFVRPAAILWCVVYALLAKKRGAACRVLVPLNFGVCTYLKSVGLFEMLLESKVELDDRGISKLESRQVILPLTMFETETAAEELANRAMAYLKVSRVGAANIYPVVSETFGELAVNAVQHAESSIGAFGLIQFYAFKRREYFVCCVADGGIGVRRSLEKNPKLKGTFSYDWTALEMAVRERVSGTGEVNRGIGLFGVAEDMKKAGRILVIHSGLGALSVSDKADSKAKRSALFPGTLAYVSIPA
ncbi:MAG: hypothetical protein HY666_00115 [Chloroflexi bacterium]|nr:hypothetical protein [Chloroflexota bacterium]